MSQTSSVYFSGMNTLRFAAAFSILLYHLKPSAHIFDSVYLQNFWHNLSVAVDFFFVISGFLITFLLLHEKENKQTISFAGFYVRRAARIFPLYYGIVIAAYLQYHNSDPQTAFGAYACFWGNFALIKAQILPVSLLIPLWSLSIEQHFYLVIPALVYFLPIKRLNIVLVGLVLATIAFRIHLFCSDTSAWFALYAHTFSRGDALLIGCLLGVAHFRRPFILPYSGRILFVSGCILVANMCLFDIWAYNSILKVGFQKYLLLLPFLGVFLSFLFGTNTYFAAWRSNKIMDYLGKISYGLYMYHFAVSNLCLGLTRLIPTDYWWFTLILLSSVTALVAAFSYEFLEKPIQKFASRYLSRTS
jgi:peptidoglycan/LPS O-acetylase OafA/YrhL